jgi:hypothetical protein
MDLKKNFYDKKAPSRNLVTTITGIVTLIIAVLVGFGIISLDQQAELEANAITIIEGIVAIYAAVNAIILMFKAKDA